MVNVVLWLAVGTISGWLAKRVGGDQEGLLRNSLIGIVGACLAAASFNYFSIDGPNAHFESFSMSSLLVALIGAGVLLGIVNLFYHYRD